MKAQCPIEMFGTPESVIWHHNPENLPVLYDVFQWLLHVEKLSDDTTAGIHVQIWECVVTCISFKDLLKLVKKSLFLVA
jgi:hypothetical protein